MHHESGFSTSTKNPPVATPVALFKFPPQCHSTHLQSAFLHKTLPPCDCQVTGFFVHKLLKLQHSWCQAGYKNGHEDQGEASLHQRLHGFFKLILLDKNSAEVEIYMKTPNKFDKGHLLSASLVDWCRIISINGTYILVVFCWMCNASRSIVAVLRRLSQGISKLKSTLLHGEFFPSGSVRKSKISNTHLNVTYTE